MNLHPDCGRRYVHIFPKSPFFSEIHECYRSAALRLPWMTVSDYEDWTAATPDWNDPEAILVFWGWLPVEVPEKRSAGFVFRYTESVGDPELLAAGQAECLRAFSARALLPDLLLGGNPVVADYWSKLYRAVAFAPAGYEPAVMGTPDWYAEKNYDLAFRGTNIERRTWILPLLEGRFKERFRWIQAFGNERKRQLEECCFDLYIGHSSDYAFPGMRIWQAISSSTALIMERRNAWPAVPGRHFVSVEQASREHPEAFLEAVSDAVLRQPFQDIARLAHDELSAYTIDRCMEEFVIPATKGLRG